MRDNSILRKMVPAASAVGCCCGSLVQRGERYLPTDDGPKCAACVTEDFGLAPLPGSRKQDR